MGPFLHFLAGLDLEAHVGLAPRVRTYVGGPGVRVKRGAARGRDGAAPPHLTTSPDQGAKQMKRKLLALSVMILMAFGGTAAVGAADHEGPGPNGHNDRGLCHGLTPRYRSTLLRHSG